MAEEVSQPEPGFVEALVDDGAELTRECPAVVIELLRGGRVSIRRRRRRRWLPRC